MSTIADVIAKDFSTEIIEHICGFLGPTQICGGECQGFPPRDLVSGWDLSKEKKFEMENIFFESLEFYVSLVKTRRNIFLVESSRVGLWTTYNFFKFKMIYEAFPRYPKKGKITFVGGNFITEFMWDEFRRFNRRFRPDKFYRYRHGNFHTDYLLAKMLHEFDSSY